MGSNDSRKWLISHTFGLEDVRLRSTSTVWDVTGYP